VVVETYQGPSKYKWQHRTIKMVLKQRGIYPLHYPSHPECQCMAVHGWEGRTHQGRYKPRNPSVSSGKCPTTSLDAGYAVDSIRWQSGQGSRIIEVSKKWQQRDGLTYKNLDTKPISKVPYILQNTPTLIL
jgi:hypothetical protein